MKLVHLGGTVQLVSTKFVCEERLIL